MTTKKPTKIHELQGTLQPCRCNKNEPKPQSDIITVSPPSEMSKSAKALWEFAVSAMPRNMVTTLDIGCFARWCTLFDDYMKLQKHLKKCDLVIYDDEGNCKINPIHNQLLKISAELRGIEIQLGFTPASRSKVSLVGEKNESDNGFLDL